MNVKIDGDEELLSKLKCYALLAPHLDGGGAGNSARSLNVAGRRCILAWKNNVSLAFGADCGFYALQLRLRRLQRRLSGPLAPTAR